MKRVARVVVLVLFASLAFGCAAPGDRARTARAAGLGFAIPTIGGGDDEATARTLERELAESEDLERERRFWLSYFLADVHLNAAFTRPFLTEPTGGIRNPSLLAHLVASIDHASRARDLFDVVQSRPMPAEFDDLTFEGVGARLDLGLAIAYSRIGFLEEIGRLVARTTELRSPATCVAYLERIDLRRELRPWVCESIAVVLRTVNELDAYRFAILAIEGRERFGSALTRDATAGLEEWILNGASVRFVCPRSQTTYVPGRTTSPVSGVPHLEYVPVRR